MSEQIKNGGPAFPAKVSVNRDTGDAVPYQFGNNDFYVGGMTLRDYLAGKVIGAAYRELFIGWRENEYAPDEKWPDGIATDAYRVADAMLSAREAKS